ncbi:MAG TPA: hypothetical protein VMT36_00700, partial [Candidatus Saccharimonadia bacterium]|nr:hypothetical protein [Candidatus Saccharimonadia bacterium]
GEVLLLVALPLLFPDGQLPSPRWRWLASLIAVGAVVTTGSQAIGLLPHGETAAEYLAEPLNGTTLPGLIGAMTLAGQLVTGLIGPLAATVAIVLRLRRSVGVERQQMRWFTYAIAVAVVGVILYEVVLPYVGVGMVVFTLGILLIPIALGTSIFRYRLYEIDRIISRTVGYAAVTATLALVFVGVVLGLQTILDPLTRDNTVAVAASTLIVAALFQPLRRRIQRVVDRRFDRARYDGQTIVDGFARQMRDEVDLDRLRTSLVATADDVVRPVSASVWLRSVEAGR